MSDHCFLPLWRSRSVFFTKPQCSRFASGPSARLAMIFAY
jgi:hypothetical protein